METEEEFALPAAWEQVRVLLGYVVALFGAPGALAAQMFLRAAMRFQLLQWLAPVEALARRLLAIEALGLPAPNAPPPQPSVRDAPLHSTLTDLAAPAGELGAPETWRVVFNLAPGCRAGVRLPAREGEVRGEPLLLRNALPLARRLEALWRLAAERGPALRRMSRLLAARRALVRERFTVYAPRCGLRLCPAATLLKTASGQLALALAVDTT